jgi:hypothetical protein
MRITKTNLQALIQEELTYIMAEDVEGDDWDRPDYQMPPYDEQDANRQESLAVDTQDREDASKFVDNILPEWAAEFEVEPHSDLTQIIREKLETLYMDILDQSW